MRPLTDFHLPFFGTNQTCKYFYDGYYNDFHVWLYQLPIFPLPFGPVDPKQMSAGALRRFVTTPYRFEAFLKEPSTTEGVFTIQKRIVVGYQVLGVKLVPGGRWLMVTSQRESLGDSPHPPWRLQIWDLHGMGTKDLPQPTASKDDLIMPRELAVQPGTQADGFLILIRSQQSLVG